MLDKKKVLGYLQSNKPFVAWTGVDTLQLYIDNFIMDIEAGKLSPNFPAPQKQQPSVGRMVHYMSYGSADGTHKSEPRAAIITGIEGGTVVHLAVLNPTGMYFNQSVLQGNEVGQWNWPPFVGPK